MRRSFVLLPALVLSSVLAGGQAVSTNGGSIEGDITDPSGAKVTRANVTITNPDTGLTKFVKTDQAGFYSVGPLPPGGYKVRIQASGFQTLDVSNRGACRYGYSGHVPAHARQLNGNY